METSSLTDRALYAIASLLSRFYSEATREWAERTVEELEGSVVEEVYPEDVDSGNHSPSQDGTHWMVPGEKIKLFSGDRRQRGLTAITIAMKYRFKQYWVILLIPVAIYLITIARGQAVSLRNIGIYFDLFGAIIVVRSLYRTPAEVDYQSKNIIPTSPAGNPEDKLVVAVETVDSMFGSTLLAAGFALQLFAVSSSYFTIAIIILVIIGWLGIQ